MGSAVPVGARPLRSGHAAMAFWRVHPAMCWLLAPKGHRRTQCEVIFSTGSLEWHRLLAVCGLQMCRGRCLGNSEHLRIRTLGGRKRCSASGPTQIARPVPRHAPLNSRHYVGSSGVKRGLCWWCVHGRAMCIHKVTAQRSSQAAATEWAAQPPRKGWPQCGH